MVVLYDVKALLVGDVGRPVAQLDRMATVRTTTPTVEQMDTMMLLGASAYSFTGRWGCEFLMVLELCMISACACAVDMRKDEDEELKSEMQPLLYRI